MPAPPQPEIRVRDEDVFLGEEVLFRAGLCADEVVDAAELYGPTCELTIVAPGGAASVHPREPSIYDGPSKIRSYFHREHLIDLLDVPLVAGVYELRFACEGRVATKAIRVRARERPAPNVAFSFPERLDLGPGRPFTVGIELASAPSICVVAPDACYAASVVGYMSAEDPPSWWRLDRRGEREATERTGYRTAINLANRSALATIDLARAHRHAATFEEAFRAGTDARWRPRERFTSTVGLVVHELAPDVNRPIRWLRRTHADYDARGVRLATREARPRTWDWAHVSPSGA
jgi:hypothetical protein